jgi:hypothetical protein
VLIESVIRSFSVDHDRRDIPSGPLRGSVTAIFPALAFAEGLDALVLPAGSIWQAVKSETIVRDRMSERLSRIAKYSFLSERS